MKRVDRRAFTLLEVVAGLFLLFVIFAAALTVFRFWTSASRHGVLQSETTLEGALVLREISHDLSHSCWEWDDQKVPVHTITNLLHISPGHFPNTRYTILVFPRTGSVEHVAPIGDAASDEARQSRRLTNRVTYSFSPSRLLDGVRFPQDFPLYSLTREEAIHPRHPDFGRYPGGIRRKTLSDRVVQMEICPYTLSDAGGNQEQFFWITVQIAERATPNAHAKLDSAAGKFFPKNPDVTLLEFFRVVRPAFLDGYRRMAGPKVYMPSDYSRVSYFDPQSPPLNGR